jgi:hypothetical protein
VVFLASAILVSQLSAVDPDLVGLLLALRNYGVKVHFAPPPAGGVYGLYRPSTRELWVAPVTQDLGIFRQVLLHEAVHAAQSCPHGVPSPLGFKTKLSPHVEPAIRWQLRSGYTAGSTGIEQEAFALQARDDAVPLLIQSLKRRCRPVNR